MGERSLAASSSIHALTSVVLPKPAAALNQTQRSGQAAIQHFDQAWPFEPITYHRWPIELCE